MDNWAETQIFTFVSNCYQTIFGRERLVLIWAFCYKLLGWFYNRGVPRMGELDSPKLWLNLNRSGGSTADCSGFQNKRVQRSFFFGNLSRCFIRSPMRMRSTRSWSDLLTWNNFLVPLCAAWFSAGRPEGKGKKSRLSTDVMCPILRYRASCTRAAHL